ncbi:hypothetical protein [Riemerella columbipharyngis]|uniref:Head domain of trimeric autotransporter adhesin n=1 Tax=Riemerella columbipharyngis TaxID=1071918 RepID=A0A1G7CCY1_9FLAO|nr:hypothetical protein [Riemerella columbipharyngis]SDE37093.1 Head domain of trimeric autotransporter adhesin [Riemerella columbipharyngis]
MKKKLINVSIFCALCAGTVVYAQQGSVGINTDEPKATLHIKPYDAKETATNNEGIIVPILSKKRVANIAEPQEGTLIYVNNSEYDTNAYNATQNHRVSRVGSSGYYWYNGDQWVNVLYTAGQGMHLGANEERTGVEPTEFWRWGLDRLTQENKTGLAIIGRPAANFGNIGDNAVDVSYSQYTVAEATDPAHDANDVVGKQQGETPEAKGATGNYAFAAGWNTVASGEASFAAGKGSFAKGRRAVAIGADTYAIGDRSVAMGNESYAKGSNSVAMGSRTIAKGSNSVAMGSRTIATEFATVAMGSNNQALGQYATVMGINNIAKTYAETIMGSNTTPVSEELDTDGNPLYHTYPITGSRVFTPIGARLFTVGNGSTAEKTYSDAFMILRNGRTGINIDNFEKHNSGAMLVVNGAIQIYKGGNTSIIGKSKEGGGTYTKDDADDTTIGCNESNEGSFRYNRSSDGNTGFFEGCVKTGANSYTWKRMTN